MHCEQEWELRLGRAARRKCTLSSMNGHNEGHLSLLAAACTRSWPLGRPCRRRSAVLYGRFGEHTAVRREGPMQSFSGRLRPRFLRIATKDRTTISRILINASARVILGGRAHPLSCVNAGEKVIRFSRSRPEP